MDLISKQSKCLCGRAPKLRIVDPNGLNILNYQERFKLKIPESLEYICDCGVRGRHADSGERATKNWEYVIYIEKQSVVAENPHARAPGGKLGG